MPAMSFLKKSAKPVVDGATSLTHSPSTLPTRHAGQHQAIAQSHRIFTIPEILEKILSSLSPYTLKYRAGLVCRLWRELSLRILLSPSLTAIWLTSLDTKEEKSIFKDKLAICSCLHLKDESNYYYTLSRKKRAAVWEELQEAVVIQFLFNKSFRISQLIVEGNLPMSTTVDQLLLSAPLLAKTLTTIRIEKYCAEPVYYIDRLLGTCENLLDLHLEAARIDSAQPVRLELRAESDFWLNRTKKSLRLQRLAVKYWHVPLELLEALLPHSQFVKSLDIVDVYGLSSPLSPLSLFYRLVAGCLPSLEHIHISCRPHYMKPSDALVFQEVFNRVKSWSIEPCDIQHGFWQLREPALPAPHALTPNVILPILTSLNVMSGCRSYGYNHHSDVIHTYLVSPAAESLEHLRVEGYRFRLEQFDPNSPYYYRPWTCRRLESLYLDMLNESRVTTSAPDSRVVLGYLTQLLPRMRSLTLKFNLFDFDLDGGLCFLKRMRYLESAYLGSKNYGAISEKNMHWLNRSPTVPIVPTVSQKIRKKAWMAQLRHLHSKSMALEGATTLTSSERSLKDLIECLQDNDGDGCLPCLESLILETRHMNLKSVFRKSDTVVIQFMRSLRPDCYFGIIRLRE